MLEKYDQNTVSQEDVKMNIYAAHKNEELERELQEKIKELNSNSIDGNNENDSKLPEDETTEFTTAEMEVIENSKAAFYTDETAEFSADQMKVIEKSQAAFYADEAFELSESQMEETKHLEINSEVYETVELDPSDFIHED
jgi:hypothetical protein